MKILGLNFGHDAGVAVIEDGQVTFLAHLERVVGQKKAYGLSYDTLAKIFERAGIRPEEFDFCAITTTQGIDIALDGSKPLRIELTRHPADILPSTLADTFAPAHPMSPRELLHPSSLSPADKKRAEKRTDVVIQQRAVPREHCVVTPTLNRAFVDNNAAPARKAPLRKLSEGLPTSIEEFSRYKADFTYPVTLVWDEHRIPAAYVSHHAAHAASVYYQSAHEQAAIMTLDGGTTAYEGGLFWLGTGNNIVPLRMHYLELGALYLDVAHNALKLGGSAEGKMMGLAPYGKPAFFDPRFVANGGDMVTPGPVAKHWLDHIKEVLQRSPDYVVNDLGNPEKMTTPINADIAASAQLLFEETMLTAVGQLSKILKNLNIDTDTLCLSGGCMLNCPTNSRISRETAFRNVYVEPSCDDGGLPMGGALWVYHNLLGHSRTLVDPVKRGLPYLGLPLKPSDFETALSAHADKITVSQSPDIAKEGARRLVAGQVIGWFEGRSEIGPRALGHRSIVADPRSAETWQRVNTIKGRELWRPLAPSVLAEHSAEWFSGLPPTSPFMMFVGTVTGPGVPAIAHIDGTARVQTVSPECGGYYHLIKQFHALTGCAVVLNTSMNGPGEPIAEYPADAIKMLLDGRFDCLMLEGRIIERRNAA